MPVSKEVPICTMILVAFAIAAHSLVLVGNLKTSQALNSLGDSMGGWSDVGFGVGDAMKTELNNTLTNISGQLATVIEQLEVVEGYLMMNVTDGTASLLEMLDKNMKKTSTRFHFAQGQKQKTLGHKPGALLELNGSAREAAELHEAMARKAAVYAVGRAAEVADAAVTAFSQNIWTEIDEQMKDLQDMLMPVLDKVQGFMLQVSDEVTAGMNTFTVTIDKAQKIFDQVMQALSAMKAQKEMEAQTFNLFDVSGTGFITTQDLKDTASIYAVLSLAGTKAEDLMSLYDYDESGGIDKDEFHYMVGDASVPEIMATVLHAYAKKLSEFAGDAGQSTVRSQVAEALVDYLQLVSAKNMTKVAWVSQALTNGSVPLAFSVDVMTQLAMAVGDPDSLSAGEVGPIIMATMADLNLSAAGEIVMATGNTTAWFEEGKDPKDMEKICDQVTNWFLEYLLAKNGNELGNITTTGKTDNTIPTDIDGWLTKVTETIVVKIKATPNSTISLLANGKETIGRLTAVKRAALLASLPEAMSRSRRRDVADTHLRQAREYQKLFEREKRRRMYVELFQAAPAVASPATLAAKANSIKAAPETIKFINWLADNASEVSEMFGNLTNEYTGKSSEPSSSMATQVMSMLKKASSFVNMMKPYATAQSINNTKDTIVDFLENGQEQLLDWMKTNVGDSLEVLGVELGHGAEKSAAELRRKLMQGTRRARVDRHDVRRFLDGEIGSIPRYPSRPERLFELVEPSCASHTVRMQGVLMEHGALAHRAPNISVEGVAACANLPPSFSEMSNLITTLKEFMPSSITVLKTLQKNVGQTAGVVLGLFQTLKTKAPPLMQNISSLYKIIWIAYFCLMTPLLLTNLFYAYWASGWFGGPKALPNAPAEPKKSFKEKMKACCRCCTSCCRKCTDSGLCLWSFLILMEVIVLVVWVMCIVLVILAGVQFFIVFGCKSIYILGDEQVCAQGLTTVNTFLKSIKVDEFSSNWVVACNALDLPACLAIEDGMKTSMMYLIIGGASAIFFHFQLIIDAAMMHERARMRRKDKNREVEARGQSGIGK